MLRELTQQELDVVTGGWGEVTLGNPGNFKPVGRAGETPSNNENFITGGPQNPTGNGRSGNSSSGV
jgi:hypothetical protein